MCPLGPPWAVLGEGTRRQRHGEHPPREQADVEVDVGASASKAVHRLVDTWELTVASVHESFEPPDSGRPPVDGYKARDLSA
jgi:hypothetical protein